LLNGELKWDGKLEPGRGQTNTDFSKKIVICKDSNYILPSEVFNEKEKPNSKAVEKKE
jgi:hypothetical protein